MAEAQGDVTRLTFGRRVRELRAREETLAPARRSRETGSSSPRRGSEASRPTTPPRRAKLPAASGEYPCTTLVRLSRDWPGQIERDLAGTGKHMQETVAGCGRTTGENRRAPDDEMRPLAAD